MLTRGYVAKNSKTRFSYVLYSNKTWLFDQSERAQGPISIINLFQLQSNVLVNRSKKKLRSVNKVQLLGRACK